MSDISVFISHSTKDSATAATVARAFTDRGIPCFFSPQSIGGGSDYQREIMRAIRQCQVLVLLFSRNAAQSKHVAREVTQADDRNKHVVPFIIDDLRFPDDVPSDYVDKYEYLFTTIQVVPFVDATHVVDVTEGFLLRSNAVAAADAAATTKQGWPEGAVERFALIARTVVADAQSASADDVRRLSTLAASVESRWLTTERCDEFVRAALSAARIGFAGGDDVGEAPTSPAEISSKAVNEFHTAVLDVLTSFNAHPDPALARAVVETIEERIGAELYGTLDDDQLNELERLQDLGDVAGFNKYFRAHVPDYEELIKDNYDTTIGDLAEHIGELKESSDPVELWTQIVESGSETDDSVVSALDTTFEEMHDAVVRILEKFTGKTNPELAVAVVDTVAQRFIAAVYDTLDDDQSEELDRRLDADDGSFDDYLSAQVPDYEEIVRDKYDTTVGEVAEHIGELTKSTDPVGTWAQIVGDVSRGDYSGDDDESPSVDADPAAARVKSIDAVCQLVPTVTGMLQSLNGLSPEMYANVSACARDNPAASYGHCGIAVAAENIDAQQGAVPDARNDYGDRIRRLVDLLSEEFQPPVERVLTMLGPANDTIVDQLLYLANTRDQAEYIAARWLLACYDVADSGSGGDTR